ncbi:MAG: RHS repeat-associated core domain-containing protein [Nitrospiraceae bacterium]
MTRGRENWTYPLFSSSNPFQYTGRENDHAKIYYYRARYYHPNLSRFLNEDPIGLLGGVNVYVYARNNVNRFRDPLGLVTGRELAVEVGIGIIGGVVIGAGLIIESPALIVAGVVIVVVDGVVVGVKAVKEVREAVKERERRLEEIDRSSIQPRLQGTSDSPAPSGVGQSISDTGASAEKGTGGRILGGRK